MWFNKFWFKTLTNVYGTVIASCARFLLIVIVIVPVSHLQDRWYDWSDFSRYPLAFSVLSVNPPLYWPVSFISEHESFVAICIFVEYFFSKFMCNFFVWPNLFLVVGNWIIALAVLKRNQRGHLECTQKIQESDVK